MKGIKIAGDSADTFNGAATDTGDSGVRFPEALLRRGFMSFSRIGDDGVASGRKFFRENSLDFANKQDITVSPVSRQGHDVRKKVLKDRILACVSRQRPPVIQRLPSGKLYTLFISHHISNKKFLNLNF
ncbi:MAG: hypothetical protein LBS03_05630 [Bacteroidales bacterium]|jgi:hypothetical protein|nr:hypothetical protein [Bacteroidales bacterium]